MHHICLRARFLLNVATVCLALAPGPIVLGVTGEVDGSLPGDTAIGGSTLEEARDFEGIDQLVGERATVVDGPDVDELVVTVSEPLLLDVPVFVDHILGQRLGRTMRGGLAQVRMARVGVAFDHESNAGGVSLLPTGRVRASGRLAGGTVVGDVILRHAGSLGGEARALPSASLIFARSMRAVDFGATLLKRPTRMTSGLTLRANGAVPLSAGFARARNFRGGRTRYVERQLLFGVGRGDRFAILPRFHERRYVSGTRVRWLDWTMVVDDRRLCGPLRLGWTRTRTRHVHTVQHVVGLSRGVEVSWVLQRASDRAGGSPDATWGLGADLRDGTNALFRLRWRRQRSSGRDDYQLLLGRLWRLGPVRVGGLRARYREVSTGVWEARLSGTLGVPLTLERPAGGSIRHRWGG